MSRPRDEQKIQLIGEACMRLVLQNGFNSLRMSEVAKEAGIATGTLYIYFPDKQTLLIEVFRRTKAQLADALFSFNAEGHDFYQIFRNWWFNYSRYALQFPDRILFVEQFLHSGFIPQSVIDETDQLFIPLDAFLIHARESGLLIQLDTQLIKAQLMGPMNELIKLFNKRQDLLTENTIELIFHMAWNSVQPVKL
jgi:AcrR family transcriptional regulator